MDRRSFIVASVSALAAPLAADAQPAAKVVPRIGFLGLNPGANLHLRGAFLQELRDLGYVEGRNVVIEYRSAEGTIPPSLLLRADQVIE
jgi:putative ABC transport system substrate-binding protein